MGRAVEVASSVRRMARARKNAATRAVEGLSDHYFYKDECLLILKRHAMEKKNQQGTERRNKIYAVLSSELSIVMPFPRSPSVLFFLSYP